MDTNNVPVTIQEILSLKATPPMKIEDRLRIKARGRPCPQINLTQNGKNRTGDFTRRFNHSLYKTWPWLSGCPVENALYCFPCVVFSKNDSVWTKSGFRLLSRMKEKCEKHDKSKEHLDNSMSMALMGTVNIRTAISSAYAQSITAHNQLVDKNRAILDIILRCIVFCGRLELPLRGNDESESSENRGVFLEQLDFIAEFDQNMREHLERERGRGSAIYISDTIQNELLDCCYAVYLSEIKRQIQEAPYVAIMADETTDTATLTQLVIVYRYLFDGEIVERFWGFFNPDSTNAEGISRVLLAELEKILPYDKHKLIGQTFDGAAVMRGEKNGVKVKLQLIYPYAHYVHCYAHQLNLILKKSAQAKSSKKFFTQITAVSNYFSRSPNKLKTLSEFMARRMGRPCPTRWNFSSRLVKTVKDNLDAIVSALEQINNEGAEDTVLCSNTLLQYLKSESFLFWLNQYYSIFVPVEYLFKQLQARQLDISVINSNINHFQIKLEKIKSNIKKSNCSSNKMNEVVQIIDSITLDIADRLDYKGHLIADALFDTGKFSNYSLVGPPQDALKTAVEKYPFITLSELETELSVVYGREEFTSFVGLKQIFNYINESNLVSLFPQAYKTIQVLLTVPMTTVEPERQFSTLDRIKTVKRTKMGEDRLNALTAISLNKKFFKEKSTRNKIIDLFASLKDRKMELNYK